jgi:hypothetical protein
MWATEHAGALPVAGGAAAAQLALRLGMAWRGEPVWNYDTPMPYGLYLGRYPGPHPFLQQHSPAPALSGLPGPAFSWLPNHVLGGSPVLPGLQQGYGVFIQGPAFSRPASPVLPRPGSAGPMPDGLGGGGQLSVGKHSPALSGLPHPAFSGLPDPVFGGSTFLPGLQQGYGVFLQGPAFSRPVSPVLSAGPIAMQSPRGATSWHRWEVNGQAIANMRDLMEASLAPVSPVLSPRFRPASPVSGSVGPVLPLLTAQRGLSPVGGVIPAPFSSGILQMPPQPHTAFQDYQDPYLRWKMEDKRLLDDFLMHPLLSHIN